MLDIILVILFAALAIFVGVKAANKNNCVGLNLPHTEPLPAPVPTAPLFQEKSWTRHLYWREIPPQYLKLTIKNTHDGHFSVSLQGLKNPSFTWSIQASNSKEAFTIFCKHWHQLSIEVDSHFINAAKYYWKSHNFSVYLSDEGYEPPYGSRLDRIKIDPDTEDEPTVIG